VDARLLTSDQKNAAAVICPRCNSIVLRPSQAQLHSQPVGDEPTLLPKMHAATNADQPAGGIDDFPADVCRQFWKVADLFSFENVGFSNSVGDRKFLICADCEIGPIGYQDLHTKYSYVAISRVRHQV